MSIDLHCHTQYSDGSTPLFEVIELAKQAGVTTLAITDHDTMVGCAQAAQLGKAQGIRILPGVEISAADTARGGKAHILCYAPQNPRPVLDLIDRITADRKAAMLRSVDKVTKLYPISREMILRRAEGSTNIYKQHVMQALMDAGYAAEMFGEVFRFLYDSKTGAAYEDIAYPDVYTVLDTIEKAGGIAVLAHPSEYHSLPLLQELCERGRLGGVEYAHPRNTPEDQAVIHELAQRYHLAETGGTDFHGFYTTRKNPIGSYLTTDAEFHKLFIHQQED